MCRTIVHHALISRHAPLQSIFLEDADSCNITTINLIIMDGSEYFRGHVYCGGIARLYMWTIVFECPNDQERSAIAKLGAVHPIV